MRLFTLFLLSAILCACRQSPTPPPLWLNKFCLFRGETIIAKTHLEIMWQDSLTKVFLRKEKRRIKGAIPASFEIWLTLNKVLPKGDTLRYHLFDDGGDYLIFGDTLFIYDYPKIDTEVYMNEWLYKKNGEYPIMPEILSAMPNDDSLYKYYLSNNEITKVSKHDKSYSTVLSIPMIIGINEIEYTSLFNGLYKWNAINRKLEKVSEVADDISKMGDGIYFIPSPGTGVHLKYRLKALALKLNAVNDTLTAPDILE